MGDLTTKIGIQGSDEVLSVFGEFYRELRTVGSSVEDVNNQMREHSRTVYAQRRALMLLRTEYRMAHAAQIAAQRVMRDIGRIGREIVSMWQAYNIAQMRIENTSRDLARAQMDLAESQEWYNQMVRDFGERSIYAIDALDNLKDAQERVDDASRAAAKAQQDFWFGVIGIILSAIGTAALIPNIFRHFNELKNILGATGLAGVFSGLGVSIGGVVSLIGTKLAAAFTALKVAMLGHPLILLAVIIGTIIIGILHFTGMLDPLYEALGHIAEKFWEASANASAFGQQMEDLEAGGVTIPNYLMGPEMELGGYQFGGMGVVRRTGLYRMHAGEPYAIGAKAIGQMGGIGTGKLVSVTIHNTFTGPVSGEFDLERAADVSYKKFIDKLGDQY